MSMHALIRRPDIAAVVLSACFRHDLEVEDLLEGSLRRASRARREVLTQLRDEIGLSYGVIVEILTLRSPRVAHKMLAYEKRKRRRLH